MERKRRKGRVWEMEGGVEAEREEEGRVHNLRKTPPVIR